MIINDTREYHFEQKPGHMNYEKTLSLTIEENMDLFSGSHGAVVGKKLFNQKETGSETLDLLEIGPGNGYSGAFMLKGLRQLHQGEIRYLGIDMSPQLLFNSVLNQCDLELDNVSIELELHDAHEISNLNRTFDLIYASEMIGDLVTLDHIPFQWIKEDNPDMTAKEKEYLHQLRDLLQKGNIKVVEQERIAFNLGAMSLIEQVYSLLKPGGAAFVSEHSCEMKLPGLSQFGSYFKKKEEVYPFGKCFEVGLDSHIEYNVHFSHLAQLASHYFEVERGRVVDLFPIKADAKVLVPTVLEDYLEKKNCAQRVYERFVEDFGWLVDERHKLSGRTIQNYLERHPRMLMNILDLTEKEFQADLGIYFESPKDIYGQFEYLLLKKPLDTGQTPSRVI